MRTVLLFSGTSWAVAWTAAFALAAPLAAAQDGGTAAQAREAGPRAGFSDENDDDECKLITVERGEGAQLVEEKTPEQGREFVFLESQEGLLEEFQLDEELQEGCALAFGLSFAGGPGVAPAAAGAAPGAGLAGGPIAAGSIAGPVAAGALGLGAVAAGLAAVAAGGGGDGGSSTTPSTIPPTSTQ